MPIYPRTILLHRLHEGWDNIDRNLCVKLADLLPKCIRKYLKEKGEYFLLANLSKRSKSRLEPLRPIGLGTVTAMPRLYSLDT